MTTPVVELAPPRPGATGSVGSAPSLLERAAQLRPRLARDRAEIAEARTLPADLVDRLRIDGFFRMAQPAYLGGLELSAPDQLAVITELSKGDPSVGWFVMIASDGGYYGAHLPQAGEDQIYGRDPDAITCGFIDPVGRAETTRGGYIVRGRWPFGTGCEQAAWLASGCTTDAGEWRIFMLRREDCRVMDTWSSTGLRGTGSHDYLANDVFVPAEHTFSLESPPRRPGQLYAFPGMHRANMAGVPLGIALSTLDIVADRLLRTMPDRRNSGDDQLAHVYAQAQALVHGAESYYTRALTQAWDRAGRGMTPTVVERATFRLALTTMFQQCKEAVLRLYSACGGSAVYEATGIDANLRDVLTCAQHGLVQDRCLSTIGMALVGHRVVGDGLL